MKLFGFRITPFFLLILGLECLALLLSVCTGIFLYYNATQFVTTEMVEQTMHMGPVQFIMLLILSPVLFSRVRILYHLLKSIRNVIFGIAISLLTMGVVILTNYSGMNSETVFIAALLSAGIGLVAYKSGLYDKCCYFLFKLKNSFRE